MENLDNALNLVAENFAVFSVWAVPVAWGILGIYVLRQRLSSAGMCFLAAGASSLLFSWLFASGSWFTKEWATDAPLNVVFSYQPIGFILANALPAFANFLPIVGGFILARRLSNPSFKRMR